MNMRVFEEKWTVVIVFFIVFLSSCGLPYCIKLPFTEEELKWTEPYTTGDTILFVGTQSNTTDTFIIKDKDIFNPSNTFIFDTEGCKWWNGDNEFKAIIGYDFILNHNSDKFKCSASLRKVCDKKPLMFKTYFMGRLSDSIYIQETRNNQKVDFAKIKNIAVRDSDFTERIAPDSIALREIYWNRDKGLTGYKIGDELYVLKE